MKFLLEQQRHGAPTLSGRRGVKPSNAGQSGMPTQLNLPRYRPLKRWRTRPPQRIALWLAMGVRVRKPIRMAGVANVPILTVAIRRRGLRQPRRITYRAEIDGSRVHMVADGLQSLQDGLPLFPIQLPQERPQPLNERIFQQRLAV